MLPLAPSWLNSPKNCGQGEPDAGTDAKLLVASGAEQTQLPTTLYEGQVL